MARHEFLTKAKAAMDDRYREVIDVAKLAREVGVSREHLTREFRRVYGIPPHRYLRDRRLESAAAYLRTTDLPVSTICRMVGLASATSFSTTFHEAYGCSPSDFRRKEQGRSER